MTPVAGLVIGRRIRKGSTVLEDPLDDLHLFARSSVLSIFVSCDLRAACLS